METHIIIIGILWGTMSMLAALEYIQACRGLSTAKQIIVSLIFAFGGPIFAISNILTGILDLILPEGWDNDGSKGY